MEQQPCTLPVETATLPVGKELLKKGASVNARNARNKNALPTAGERGKISVQVLVKLAEAGTVAAEAQASYSLVLAYDNPLHSALPRRRPPACIADGQSIQHETERPTRAQPQHGPPMLAQSLRSPTSAPCWLHREESEGQSGTRDLGWGRQGTDTNPHAFCSLDLITNVHCECRLRGAGAGSHSWVPTP